MDNVSRSGVDDVDPRQMYDPLERTSDKSLVDVLTDRIQDMITSGVLVPGKKLNEHAISQKLEVSRGALREAVRLLERAGLLTIQPNKGVFVRSVSVKEALDLFDVRAGLGLIAGRLGAMRADEAQIDALDALHSAMTEAFGASDFSRYFDCNTEFHQLIFKTTRNETLAQLDKMISAELHLFRRRNLGSPAQLKMSLAEHEAICRAFRERDAAKAAEAMERHVLAGRERMLDQLPEE